MRKKPTSAELSILKVLWSRGPSTVREVHDALPDGNPTGYTTTLKLLQLRAEKDLVTRDAKPRAHVYRAKAPRDKTQSQLLGELVDTVFGGSASRLVLHALSTKPSTPAERAEIRRILDAMEEKR